MKNKKKIKLVLDAVGLKHFRTTPTFRDTLPAGQHLVEGENELELGHVAYSMLKRRIEYLKGHVELYNIE